MIPGPPWPSDLIPRLVEEPGHRVAGRAPQASGTAVLEGHKVATQWGRTPPFPLFPPAPHRKGDQGVGGGPYLCPGAWMAFRPLLSLSSCPPLLMCR